MCKDKDAKENQSRQRYAMPKATNGGKELKNDANKKAVSMLSCK
jgi:hypothetical protein